MIRTPQWPTAVSISMMLLAAGLPAAWAADHPAIDREQGWVSLFNGKDLTGWKTVTSDGDPVPSDTWAVEDGALTRKGGGYLRSEKQYGDFVLDLEFKVGPPDGPRRANSGILLRHTPDPELKREGKKYWWNGLLEIQIFDSHDLEPDTHACGALYDMVAPCTNSMKPPLQWNRMTVSAVGPQIVVILNGEKIIDVDLDRWTEANKNPNGTPNKYNAPMKNLSHASGYLWLQDHPGEVWYRNIHVKPLD